MVSKRLIHGTPQRERERALLRRAEDVYDERSREVSALFIAPTTERAAALRSAVTARLNAEQAQPGSDRDSMLQEMERKLLKAIMNPAMIAAWIFGLCLIATPGVVDWSAVWPWTKAASVLGMTWFHMWLGKRRKEFVAGTNTRAGRTYRMMNELPTLLLVVIVISVVARPF